MRLEIELHKTYKLDSVLENSIFLLQKEMAYCISLGLPYYQGILLLYKNWYGIECPFITGQQQVEGSNNQKTQVSHGLDMKFLSLAHGYYMSDICCFLWFVLECLLLQWDLTCVCRQIPCLPVRDLPLNLLYLFTNIGLPKMYQI